MKYNSTFEWNLSPTYEDAQQLFNERINDIVYYLDDANGYAIYYFISHADNISIKILSALLEDRGIESECKWMSKDHHYIEMKLWYKDSKSYTKDEFVRKVRNCFIDPSDLY